MVPAAATGNQSWNHNSWLYCDGAGRGVLGAYRSPNDLLLHLHSYILMSLPLQRWTLSITWVNSGNCDAMGRKNSPIKKKKTEVTQLMDSLGHTTMSGTRPTFPSRRAKISCKQWPGRKYRKERKHWTKSYLKIFRQSGNVVVRRVPVCLTMTAEHPVLGLKWDGDAGGF